jgi:hypothetical protein
MTDETHMGGRSCIATHRRHYDVETTSLVRTRYRHVISSSSSISSTFLPPASIGPFVRTMMLSSQQHRLPQQQLRARQPPKTQEEVTREWDGLAGDWDDLATATTSVSSLGAAGGNANNPNAELFRRCVRPALRQLVRERNNSNEKGGEGGLGNSSRSGSSRPSLGGGDEGAGDDDVGTIGWHDA